ncbi:hypothetical protein WAK64_10355 [Bacillus spongiae]|uniref:DUF975 family protein n=1 Tax=Bacillus spongiae TaxID=2683610 RepID=A0ABU8HDM2_9BACI
MFRETLSIYNRNLLMILLVGLTIVFPVSFFCFQAMIYILTEMNMENSYIYAAFLIIINFTLLYPPFVRITMQDLYDEESLSITELVKIFVNEFGLIVMFTSGFYLIAVWGLGLAFIPTIICLVSLVVFPLFVDQKKVSGVFRKLGRVLLAENIFILIDLLLIVSINLLVWAGISFLLNSFDNNHYVFVFSRALINIAVFPLMYIYLTIKYKSERGDFYG